jgi:hypothetical protein
MFRVVFLPLIGSEDPSSVAGSDRSYAVFWG